MTNLRTRPSKLEYNNQRYVVYELCPVGNSNAEPAWYKDERKPKATANRTLNKLKESVKKIDDVLKFKIQKLLYSESSTYQMPGFSSSNIEASRFAIVWSQANQWG